MVYFKLNVNNTDRHLYPEDVGSIIISTLRSAAASNLSSPVTRAVLSVPAEFDQQQRNYTRKAAQLAGNLELFLILTLVLLNPDMSCLCKQCRSRSFGF